MRIYQSISLSKNQIIRLDEKGGHYIARVLRARVGDLLVLFNGEGGEYEAEIIRLDKKGVEVKLISFLEREVESSIHIDLAQGIARGEKMDFIVQKATELGVKKIFPLITARFQGKLKEEQKEKRLIHFRSVIASACEQCGRNQLPDMPGIWTFNEWLFNVKADYRFVLHPRAENKSLPSLPEQFPKNTSIAVLIGPEGGLTEEEMTKALQHGFLPLQLGPRILRTETATLAILAILQSRYGDM